MIGTPYTPEVDPSIAAEAFAEGLRANLTTNGGVNGGNLGLTTQIVLKTTTNSVQIGSCDNGNEVTFYTSGDNFKAGTVKTRVFLSIGQVHIETGMPNGGIVTSTKGVTGASGNDNGSGGDTGAMPLGVEGYASKQFFFFAFRYSGGGGYDVGAVYVAAGAVASEVQLLNGAGDTVVDSASLQPFGLATLLTNANAEFQVVATQPVFVGIASGQGRPYSRDMRLVPPLSTQLMGQNRNAQVSALYDDTKVWWYRHNGNVGLVTVSPGSPIGIFTNTINELGDVFRIDSNATPATAGNFTITINSKTTPNIAFDANATQVAEALFTIAGSLGANGQTITNNTTDVTVSDVGHGLSTGAKILVSSTGNNNILPNGRYKNIVKINDDSFTVPYVPTNSDTTSTINWVDLVYGEDDFEVEGLLGLNLGVASARINIYAMGLLGRIVGSPSLTVSGLTGNAHTRTIMQTGSQENNAESTANFSREGLLNLEASGPISAFSGADGNGFDAVYFTDPNANTQRIPLPLAFNPAGSSAAMSSIAIQSRYKGTANVYGQDGSLIYVVPFDRDAGLSIDSAYDQRFPCAVTMGNNSTSFPMTGDWLGGYVEADVPLNVVLNSNNNSSLIPGGIPASGDEIVCFGTTPEEIRMDLKKAPDGRYRKRVLAVDGTETWELV